MNFVILAMIFTGHNELKPVGFAGWGWNSINSYLIHGFLNWKCLFIHLDLFQCVHPLVMKLWLGKYCAVLSATNPTLCFVLKFASQWASYQIRTIVGCACAGNAGNVFSRRRIQRKPRFSDPGMHHDTCVKHVPWCMSGLLNYGGGENVPGIPGACNLTYLTRGPYPLTLQ